MRHVRHLRTGIPVRLETRADGKPMVVGYAAVYYDAGDPGTEYELLPDVVERIAPGAFDRALREDDVRALINHDPNRMLGRTKAGTLRLSVDAKGLRYEIDPPDTAYARDLMESLRRGDLDGSSFGFLPRQTTYQREGQALTLSRTDVQLLDVSPVTFPAYAATTAEVRDGRDLEAVRAEVEAWQRATAKPTDRRVVAAARSRAVAVLLADAR